MLGTLMVYARQRRPPYADAGADGYGNRTGHKGIAERQLSRGQWRVDIPACQES